MMEEGKKGVTKKRGIIQNELHFAYIKLKKNIFINNI